MKKLLIVEDEAMIREIYAGFFNEAGFEVQTEPDGQAAINKISATRFDAILLDLDLPGLAGVEIIKRIREQAHLGTLPIFVLTNAYDYRTVLNASKAGATLCLTKANTSPNQMVQTVQKHLAASAAKTSDTAQLKAASHTPVQVHGAISKTDAALHEKIRSVFEPKSAELLARIQNKWREFQLRRDSGNQVGLMAEFLQQLHLLAGLAAVAEHRSVADLSSALEALVKQMCENPQNFNLSANRTVEMTLSFLAHLLKNSGKPVTEAKSPAKVLVVDDELIARETAVSALELVNVGPTLAEDAAAALAMLEKEPFDLVLLDVDMPGMSGFELCGRLRKFPQHKRTAVIFVTGLSRFENQVQSSLCGGNDLIGKPYLLIELAVKCLTYIYRARLAQPPV
jgi:DNA-binding response OmpR family regulator